MKRLIVCCDGTWNDEDSAASFTNVVRMARAIRPQDDVSSGQSIPQIVYYHSGVGTGGDEVEKVLGGAIGLGLSRNVRDAYAFIVHNYAEGDELFLFGFSRGAYTARSVAGLIGWAGLIQKGDMDDFAMLWEGYRLRGQTPQPLTQYQFPDRRAPVRIKCIGVWDTVGALGIPGHLGDMFTNFISSSTPASEPMSRTPSTRWRSMNTAMISSQRCGRNSPARSRSCSRCGLPAPIPTSAAGIRSMACRISRWPGWRRGSSRCSASMKIT